MFSFYWNISVGSTFLLLNSCAILGHFWGLLSPFCPQDFESLVAQDVQIYICKLGTFLNFIKFGGLFMNNFREVTDDIIKEWLEFREETSFCEMSPED